MARIHSTSRAVLESRRAEILDRLGMTYEELAAKADAYSLVGHEWGAWNEIREIEFLLADERRPA